MTEETEVVLLHQYVKFLEERNAGAYKTLKEIRLHSAEAMDKYKPYEDACRMIYEAVVDFFSDLKEEGKIL